MNEYIAEKLDCKINNHTFDSILSDLHWSSQQSLFAAISNYYEACNMKKANDDFKKHWQKQIIDNGSSNNDDNKLLIKSLDSANIKDYFENNFRSFSINIDRLPPYSFLLQLGFTLAKPYISRDDKAVYLCDNPIKKDRVFGLPLIEGSSWKGNMRWTARKRIEMDIGLTHDEKERKKKKLVSLFGNEKGDEENFRKGRLHFYPTFFDKIRLEVMNPQDRATRSGKDPILIETVPANSDGVFSILYLPFDLLGLDTCETVKEFYDDLKFVTNVIKEMMLTYGFSAKKSSGFGTVINKFSGSLVIKAFNRPFVFKKKKFEELEKHVEQLKQEVEAHAGR